MPQFKIPEREQILARQDEMTAADAVDDDRALVHQAIFGSKVRANVMLTIAKDGRHVDFCASDLGQNASTHLRNLLGVGLVEQILKGKVRRRTRYDVYDRDGELLEAAGTITEVNVRDLPGGGTYFRRVDDPIWTAIDMLTLIGIDPRAKAIREKHMVLDRQAHEGTVEDLIALAGELGEGD